MKIVGIAGSLRQKSFNRSLLKAAAKTLPVPEAFSLLDGLDRLPAYNEDCDDDEVSPAVTSLRERIRAADGLIIATPEYNGSLPGFLKNALDWASRPWPDNALRGRPTLVIGASRGPFGAVWAQADLRRILRTTGATVVDFELPIGRAHRTLDENGSLHDDVVANALTVAVGQLVQRAARERELSAPSSLEAWTPLHPRSGARGNRPEAA
jgi:chromate reductase, NAD(P)H dehydrogenase (quinone)